MAAFLPLYLAVHADDVDACRRTPEVPRRLIGNLPYIGLRTTPEDAMKRAREHSYTPVDKHTHAILEVKFSEAGFLYYATLSAGAEYYFQPVLVKMVYYKDKENDWNVWHFNKDLPFEAKGPDGEVWISTGWRRID